MSNISYRIGTLEDLGQIKKLTVVAYGQYEALLTTENVRQWRTSLGDEDLYSRLLKFATCFVAEYQGQVVGTGFLIPHGNPYKWFESEWSYIRLIGVLPEFEGKGIGRKITELCIDHALKTGEKTIALHTSEFQHAARHIYESLGFKKSREFQLFDRTYWVYTLSLPQSRPLTKTPDQLTSKRV